MRRSANIERITGVNTIAHLDLFEKLRGVMDRSKGNATDYIELLTNRTKVHIVGIAEQTLAEIDAEAGVAEELMNCVNAIDGIDSKSPLLGNTSSKTRRSYINRLSEIQIKITRIESIYRSRFELSKLILVRKIFAYCLGRKIEVPDFDIDGIESHSRLENRIKELFDLISEKKNAKEVKNDD